MGKKEAVGNIDSGLRHSGRNLVNALRENFGEKLNGAGLIMRPKTEDARDITVRVAAHDTGKTHATEAVIDVAQEKGVGRVAISAVEPTIGGRRAAEPIKPATSVEIGGAADIMEPDKTIHEIETACDQGTVEVFERVA